MDYDEEYVKGLEMALSKFLEPLKEIPFSIVIKLMSGYSIIPFDKENKEDKILLKLLEVAIQKATELSNNEGIFTARVNEVGNHIEPYVRNALKEEVWRLKYH